MGADMLLILGNQDWEGDFCVVLSLHMARAAALASLSPAAEHIMAFGSSSHSSPRLLTPPLPLSLGTSAGQLSTLQLLNSHGL